MTPLPSFLPFPQLCSIFFRWETACLISLRRIHTWYFVFVSRIFCLATLSSNSSCGSSSALMATVLDGDSKGQTHSLNMRSLGGCLWFKLNRAMIWGMRKVFGENLASLYNWVSLLQCVLSSCWDHYVDCVMWSWARCLLKVEGSVCISL